MSISISFNTKQSPFLVIMTYAQQPPGDLMTRAEWEAVMSSQHACISISLAAPFRQTLPAIMTTII